MSLEEIFSKDLWRNLLGEEGVVKVNNLDH